MHSKRETCIIQGSLNSCEMKMPSDNSCRVRKSGTNSPVPERLFPALCHTHLLEKGSSAVPSTCSQSSALGGEIAGVLMFAPVSQTHLCMSAAVHGCPWSFLTLNTCRKWNFILNSGTHSGRAWAGVTRLGDFGGKLGGVTSLTEQGEQIRIRVCKRRPSGARLLRTACRNKLHSLLTAAVLDANFFSLQILSAWLRRVTSPHGS